jgi:FHA domain
MSMIDCPACGAPTPANSEFCDTCGHAFEGLPAAATPAPISTELPLPFSPAPTPAPISTELPAPSQSSTAVSPQPAFQSNAPAFTSASNTARLVSKQAGAPISEFNLETNNLIGRFDSDTGPVDIDLENFSGDDTISRIHAEIYYESGQWKVKDLGSTNGIFLKTVGDARFGTRITVPTPINHGDEIALGKVRFLFQSP